MAIIWGLGISRYLYRFRVWIFFKKTMVLSFCFSHFLHFQQQYCMLISFNKLYGCFTLIFQKHALICETASCSAWQCHLVHVIGAKQMPRCMTVVFVKYVINWLNCVTALPVMPNKFQKRVFMFDPPEPVTHKQNVNGSAFYRNLA